MSAKDAKVKKCEKKEMVLIMEKFVIIETFLNVCATQADTSLFRTQMTEWHKFILIFNLSFFAFVFHSFGKHLQFDGLHFAGNDGQVYSCRCFLYPPLVAGFHHHFPSSAITPTGRRLQSTINAYRRKNLSVFGRNDDTFPVSKPISCPYGTGRASLISSSLFRLFASVPSLLPVRFPPPAVRLPLSASLQPSKSHYRVRKVSGNVPLPLSFFHMEDCSPICPRPSPRCSVGHLAAAPINFLVIPCQQAGGTHQTPWTIRNPPACRTSVRDNPVSSSNIHKADVVFMQPVHGSVCLCNMESLPYPQQFHTAVGKHTGFSSL